MKPALLALALVFSGLGLSGQVCHAQVKPPMPPAPVAKLDPITASFTLVPSMRCTSDHIPLVLRLRNNTGKPMRVFKGFFTPELFTAAVRFELQDQNPPAPARYETHGTATTITVSTTPDFFGMMKVSFDASYRYKFLKIKPGHTEEVRFDLAELTLDKRRIPPGTYILAGFFGVNQGYPPSIGRTDDIYSSGTKIPPLALTIEK